MTNSKEHKPGGEGLSRREFVGAAAMRSPSCPEVDNYVTKFYHAGFDLVS